MLRPVVLIIEDDPIARFVFKKLIKRIELTAHEAINGQDALNIIDKNKEITHVFLDLNMPVMDGYGFLHFLNSAGNHSNLNIFITSITDESEFVSTTRKRNIQINNVKGYNKKPFDMAQLTKTLLKEDYIPIVGY
ncbi:MAG: response regulator [Taibaiella sp.]|nr:response regulator [Taibaiella sp.]